jgi:hypothetical protein
MAKKLDRKKKGLTRSRRKRMLVAITLAVCLLAGAAISAQTELFQSASKKKRNKAPTEFTAQSLTASKPSKQYIYAGSKLCAVDESPAPDTPGIFVRTTGIWFLRYTNDQNIGDNAVFGFGPAGTNWIPIAGDWDGDGFDSVGLYDPNSGYWYLKNSNSAGAADITFLYQPVVSSEAIPVVGDWDGNGTDGVALYDRKTGTWYLKNSLQAGSPDITYTYGPGQPITLTPDPCFLTIPPNDQKQDWLPIAGHWNIGSVDSPGLYVRRLGEWFLRGDNNPSNPGSAYVFYFGPGAPNSLPPCSTDINSPGEDWRPVAGDWDGDGIVTPGAMVRKFGLWYLRGTNDPNNPGTGFTYTYGVGFPTSVTQDWLPIAGHWRR